MSTKYLDSNGLSYVWGILKTKFLSNVVYDSTNKKLTKTINGTTTDIVTVSTLKTDMQIPDIIAITNAEIDTVTGIIPDNVYQAMADSY